MCSLRTRYREPAANADATNLEAGDTAPGDTPVMTPVRKAHTAEP